MTVSASIPVAVLAITIFRGLSQRLRHPAGDDPGKQHRPDGRLGGRVDRLRRRGDDAGLDAPGLRAGVDARDARGRAGGPARHLDDDPAAAGVHRQAARRAPLSRGDGLCQGLDRRRTGGVERPDGLPRASGVGFHLPDPDAGVQVLVGRMAEGDHGHHGLQQGRGLARAVADAAGRRLYHRAADRLGHGRRRHHDGAAPGADDRLLRRRAAGRPAAGPAAESPR